MFVKKRGSTIKQMAYAKRILGGQGESKKQIALNSGYSPNVANSVSSHIENKPGFNNAMSALALESNNLALSVMHEFKARDLSEFSNKELIAGLNAIGNAWSKFNVQPKEKDPLGDKNNKLRTIVLQQIENQNNQSIVSTPQDTPPTSTAEKGKITSSPPVVEVADVENDLDF